MRFMLRGAAVAAIALSPNLAHACACGCGVFAVGSMPPGYTSSVSLEFDFMDQDQNWHGSSTAPASQNDDKDIRSEFVTAGVRTMISDTWRLDVEVPYWVRHFATENDAGTGVGDFDHGAFGDVRLMASWSGLDDGATGLEFGVKLPTGDWRYPGFDRDTSIGTGSTDILLGAYHQGELDDSGAFGWFGQVLLDQPIWAQGGYRPGSEVDGAVGGYWQGWQLDAESTLKPTLQLTVSVRSRDSGVQSDRPNSGYERLIAVPGLEASTGDWRLDASVGLPLWQRFNGDQLAASELVRVVVTRAF